MPYIGQGLTEGRRRAYNFIATGGQTTFLATYDAGYVDVYQNGILLSTTDYTATNGTTVVLGVGASASDEITIIAHQIFTISDTVSATQGGSFGGAIDVTGNITTTGSLQGPSSFTIDPATHGDNTGTVVIAGDLTVNGTTTTINSTTLTVDDKNIIIASGTSNSSTADGSGLTIDLGSDGTATMLYTHATTSFNFNKEIHSPGLNTSSDIYLGGDKGIFFEGSTNDAYEVYLRATDATADRSIRLPDASGTLLIQDGTNDVTIQANTTSSGVDPTLTLYKNDTGTVSNTDNIAAISFKGTNASGGDHVFGWMESSITTATAGSEEGSFRISVAGSNTSYQNEAYAGGNGLVIYNDRTEFKNNVTLKNTSNSSNNLTSSNPVLNLYRADTYVNQWDYLGAIHFSGMNTADEEIVYARIVNRPSVITDGSEEGVLQFIQKIGGATDFTYDFRPSVFKFRNEQRVEWQDHKGTNYECSLDWETPTASRTVTFPNATGTVSLMGVTNSGNFTASGSVTANTTINVGSGGGFYLKQDSSESTIRSESQPIVLQTYASGAWQDRVFVTNAGDFGLGTNNPVSLGSNFNSFNLNGIKGGGLSFSRGTNSATQQYNIYTTDDDGLHIYRGGFANQVMTMDSSGNVGIGTTSVAGATKLDVRFSGRQGINVGSTNGAGSYLVLDGAANGDAAGSDYAYIEHNSSGNLAINVGNASNNTATRMLIEAGGNVGIGDTNPGKKLAVNGTASIVAGFNDPGLTITGGTTLQNAGKIRLQGAGTGCDHIQIVNDGNSFIVGVERSAGTAIMGGTYGYASVIGSVTNNALHFGVNNTAKMTLETSGALFFPERSNYGDITFPIGSISNSGTGARYLHAQFQVYGGAMYHIHFLGYDYTASIRQGSGGGYMYNTSGQTSAFNGAYSGNCVAVHQTTTNRVELVIDTGGGHTNNRWGSMVFFGGTDTITGNNPISIVQYAWNAYTARLYSS